MAWETSWQKDGDNIPGRAAQREGATGPPSTAKAGWEDAGAALQEDRDSDGSGDRGGKTVKKRTRPSLSPGQDGRKITEKGWANNGPPLEVP